MLTLHGEKKAFFEAKILRYEYPSEWKDDWNRNMLRASLHTSTSEGKEGKNTTYLLTKEIMWLKKWFALILSRQAEETHFDFYYGKFYFDVLEVHEKSILLRISIDFSIGKGAQLPDEREEPFEWFEQIDFIITNTQIERLMSTFNEALSLYPVRSSEHDKKR